MVSTSNIFFPEMGQSPRDKHAIIAQASYKGYEIMWPASRNESVKSALRKLRVRPSNVRKYETSYSGAPFPGDNVISAHVTYDAYHKISDAGLCATRCLLD